MPKTNTASTSGLSARCFELPAARLRRTTTSGLLAKRGEIPRVGQSITGLDNPPRLPKLLVDRAMAMARQHASRTTATLPQPEPQVPAERWVTQAKRVPISIHHDPIACHSHIQPVLLAIAAAGSDYWQQSLGGPALCVRDGDGRVACRVSPATNGGMTLRQSDAVVQLTGDGPRAYDHRLGETLPQTCQREPFCSAAAEAAQLLSSRLTGLSTEIYGAAIARREAELNASMVQWIGDNQSALEMVATRMMETRPTAT